MKKKTLNQYGSVRRAARKRRTSKQLRRTNNHTHMSKTCVTPRRKRGRRRHLLIKASRVKGEYLRKDYGVTYTRCKQGSSHRRTRSKIMSSRRGGEPAQWKWEDDNEKWQPYTPTQNDTLNHEYEKYRINSTENKEFVLLFDGLALTINFQNNTQTNLATDKVRNIKRIEIRTSVITEYTQLCTGQSGQNEQTVPSNSLHHRNDMVRVKCDTNESTVTFTNGPPLKFKWDFIETDTNNDMYEELKTCTDSNVTHDTDYKSIVNYWDNQSLEDFKDKFRLLNGGVDTTQLPKFHNEFNDTKHVTLNASQTNFLEQPGPYTGSIWENLSSFYNDPTFGPRVVRDYEGGPEFIAYTLNPFATGTECYGATGAFFSQNSTLRISNGYYTSNATEVQQAECARAFRTSTTKICGFRWMPQQRKDGYQHDTYIYQMGALNSKSTSTSYSYLHRNVGPTPELEFGVLFTQYYNAMKTESREDVVFHTTQLGGGVCGNTKCISIYALISAYHSLPQLNRNRIKAIYFGVLTPSDVSNTMKVMNPLAQFDPNELDALPSFFNDLPTMMGGEFFIDYKDTRFGRDDQYDNRLQWHSQTNTTNSQVDLTYAWIKNEPNSCTLKIQNGTNYTAGTEVNRIDIQFELHMERLKFKSLSYEEKVVARLPDMAILTLNEILDMIAFTKRKNYKVDGEVIQCDLQFMKRNIAEVLGCFSDLPHFRYREQGAIPIRRVKFTPPNLAQELYPGDQVDAGGLTRDFITRIGDILESILHESGFFVTNSELSSERNKKMYNGLGHMLAVIMLDTKWKTPIRDGIIHKYLMDFLKDKSIVGGKSNDECIKDLALDLMKSDEERTEIDRKVPECLSMTAEEVKEKNELYYYLFEWSKNDEEDYPTDWNNWFDNQWEEAKKRIETNIIAKYEPYIVPMIDIRHGFLERVSSTYLKTYVSNGNVQQFKVAIGNKIESMVCYTDPALTQPIELSVDESNVDPTQLEQLKGMGFGKNIAIRALRHSNNNIDSAIEQLLQQQEYLQELQPGQMYLTQMAMLTYFAQKKRDNVTYNSRFDESGTSWVRTVTIRNGDRITIQYNGWFIKPNWSPVMLHPKYPDIQSEIEAPIDRETLVNNFQVRNSAVNPATEKIKRWIQSTETSIEQLERFLYIVGGSKRLPIGQKIIITETSMEVPYVHTCFWHIEVPFAWNTLEYSVFKRTFEDPVTGLL